MQKDHPIQIPPFEVNRKEAYKSKGPTNDRMKAVVQAFNHSWVSYKKYAWGFDELMPLSKGHNQWFDVGLTLIESLDTMYIMDLKEGMLSFFTQQICIYLKLFNYAND